MSEQRRRPALGLAAACVVGLGLLGACGSPSSAGTGQAAASSTATSASPSSSSSAAGGGMPATATMIMIQGFRYEIPATVAPGSTVRVMNMDQEAHTVTSDRDGAFAVQVPAGQTVSFTAPSTPGRYDFHCIYHANMHGTLVVG